VNRDKDSIRDTDMREQELRKRDITGKDTTHATGTMVRQNSEHGETDPGERMRPETGAGE
jgi:hypothetical protein